MNCTLTLKGDKIVVRSPYSAALVDRFRVIPGRQFKKENGEAWNEFPAVRDVLLMVCDACGVLPWMLEDGLRKIAGTDGFQALNHVKLDMSVIEGYAFQTEPYRHQMVNLARLVQNNRWLLADEMGTGKSAVVANRLKFKIDSQSPLPCLIICPNSVISGWSKQLLDHANLVGTAYEKGPYSKYTILIVNYEKLFHDKTIFDHEWSTIILDEIHRCKNFTSQTARAVRKLTDKAKRVYGLSGTPAPNGLEDWLGVLSALDPNLLPVKTKAAFIARYCVLGRLSEDKTSPMYNVRKITGYRNVEELHQYIASVTSRFTKAECLDLPEKTFIARTVRLEGEQARVYRELKRDAVARLKTYWERQTPLLARAATATEESATLTVNNVLSESLRLLQVVGGFVPDDDGTLHELPDKAKLAALADVIDELGNKQLVVWCAFRPEADYLVKWLETTYGGGVAVLTGDVRQVVRREGVETFSKGERRFFVGTTAAGGTGINGLQVADTEVFYSRNWNYADYVQAVDRLHRIGQKNSVSVIKLVASGTVDEKVEKALERKASLQEMMLRNPEDLF